ncbi:hypothetical protein DASC09_030620 [Saccharomycopsis crataegensis]|uniref:GDP/GTP exchange factor Sec2 N-terminal domain-containing protein n=1 Tax=Saccharomycopsis crataegensis TaxID=43959 RepID=A0AAV5QMH4_9ASCO|nr:hypothetical protein DASC09_030620 [Saccharomycopsis crataegensis]
MSKDDSGDLKKSNDSLEKQLSKAKKELDRYRSEAEKLSVKYTALTNDFNEMSQKYTTSQRLRVTTETEVSGLRKEIDDLSSALFSQANDMVSTARRSENDYKVKNKQLQNKIEEKDLMIETYQQQLEQLKEILASLEDKKPSSSSTTVNEKDSTTVSDDTTDNGNSNEERKADEKSTLSNLLYTPPVQCLRYDLELFGNFVNFAKNRISKPGEDDSGHSADFKDTRFYKRILHDDIQPTLKLDIAPGVSFLQKRSLMSAIVNGRVTIEPIASVNESFKRNSAIISNASSKPVATPDPCSICGESRNDSLQHARLYMLKIYSSKNQKAKGKNGNGSLSSNPSSTNISDLNDSTSSLSINENTSAEFTYTFPLCAYCVFRIRSTCELYAFLRSVQAGVWKFDTEVNQKKAWIECTRIRLKMFWSRLGIWDTDAKIVDNKIFSAEQVIGDYSSASISQHGSSGFAFQEKKTSTEIKRQSYASTIGSYVEKFTSSVSPVSTPQKEVVPSLSPIIMEDASVKTDSNVLDVVEETKEGDGEVQGEEASEVVQAKNDVEAEEAVNE